MGKYGEEVWWGCMMGKYGGKCGCNYVYKYILDMLLSAHVESQCLPYAVFVLAYSIK